MESSLAQHLNIHAKRCKLSSDLYPRHGQWHWVVTNDIDKRMNFAGSDTQFEWTMTLRGHFRRKEDVNNSGIVACNWEVIMVSAARKERAQLQRWGSTFQQNMSGREQELSLSSQEK